LRTLGPLNGGPLFFLVMAGSRFSFDCGQSLGLPGFDVERYRKTHHDFGDPAFAVVRVSQQSECLLEIVL
jgi:hypothetical protein